MVTSVGGVQPLESEAFHQEHFELLSSELDTFRRTSSGAARMEAEEEGMSGGSWVGGWLVGW